MEEKNKRTASWFWKWFLNNKLVSILSVILLMLLIVLVASKVTFIFKPIKEFFIIIGVPVIISAVLYYLLNPIVNVAEQKFKMNRTFTIFLLFVLVILLITWGIFSLIPTVQTQMVSLIKNTPHYWQLISTETISYLKHLHVENLTSRLNEMNKDIYQMLSQVGKNIVSQGMSGVGSIISVIVNIFITVITVPFILFYLLRDGKKLLPTVLKVVPPKFQKSTKNVLIDINKQLSSYIRGQITIAVLVALIYMIGFSICGFKYAIMMGVVAGFFNIIPYLGSWMTMVPVVIIALVTSGPIMVVKVLIVHLIEQLIESRLLQPIVIGGTMEIHPLTIIAVILTSAKLFGVVGVILGIPGYAIIKVIVIHIFYWYRSVSSLYNEERNSKLIQK